MCDSIPRAWRREIQIGINYVLLFKLNYMSLITNSPMQRVTVFQFHDQQQRRV